MAEKLVLTRKISRWVVIDLKNALRTAMRRCIPLIVLLSFLLWGWRTTQVGLGASPAAYVLEGNFVTPDNFFKGELVIQGDIISCIALTCNRPPGAKILDLRNGFIYPGFVDAHNHIAYNYLPKWNPPRLYQNRYEWIDSQPYRDFIKSYADLSGKGLLCDMIRYGDIKALISGVTTIQGLPMIPPDHPCTWFPIRNAESPLNGLGIPSDYIRDIVFLRTFKDSIKPVTKAILIHLGEGIDDYSRQEFGILREKGLVGSQTVIIHGTALGESEFREMARAGAKLVWSPQSNLVLYGKTTNAKLALQFGVEVALGVDWNPSGSNNILDELRVANEVNQREFGGFITRTSWVKMITSIPARALALNDRVGRLVPGLKADVTVLRSEDSDPYLALLNARLQDVELVFVGGQIVYGDSAIVEAEQQVRCEPLMVHGSQKRLCLRSVSSPNEMINATLRDITNSLVQSYPYVTPLAP